MSLPHPVIVVPGITANCLEDGYPLPSEVVWSAVVNKDYDRLKLHPNDLRFEAIEPARIKPGDIFSICYSELIEELRHNLTCDKNKPVPVYPFNYDWRMPLDSTEALLDQFVEEVLDRTKLLKHYYEDSYSDHAQVNLVGHSMGGVIIAGYLEKYGIKAHVNKIATLAAPFRGSLEPVIKIITGTANLGTSSPSSREREMARVTPSLYQLLPRFELGITIDEKPAPADTFFKMDMWQQSVLDTLTTYIRDYGLPLPGGGNKLAEDLLSDLLLQGRQHSDRISQLKLENVGFSSDRWLAVVGADSETRVCLNIKHRDGRLDLDLNSNDRRNQWGSQDNQQRRMTGDGTVPLEGAIPTFLDENNIVIVTPDDFGYWEVQDRIMTGVAGFHGILPNMDMLHRLIVRFFTNSPDNYQNTWGRMIPGVDEWNLPFKLTDKAKSKRTAQNRDAED